MSVQTSYPSQFPTHVRFEFAGREVTGEVVASTLHATAATGPGDILTVAVGDRRLRVPASDAEAL